MSFSVLNQIADEMGVSRWTVSRVLRGEVTYSQQAAKMRAQQIRTRAAELGYRPNAAAQAIGRGRFDTLALISVADESEYVSSPLLFGLLNQASASKQHLVCERLPSEMLSGAPQLPRLLQRASCDAVLFHAIGLPPAKLTRFAATSPIPFIWVNSRRRYDSVYLDDRRGASEVTQAMIEAGHRRITLVTSDADTNHQSVQDRQAGYESAMTKAGLASEMIRLREEHLFGHAPSPAEVLGPMLSRRTRPTAVIGIDQSTATMVLVQALTQGLRVPTDLSLAGFGASITNQTGVRIAMSLTPDKAMGRAAVNMALQKIEAPEELLPAVKLSLRFKPLDTLAPPL